MMTMTMVNVLIVPMCDDCDEYIKCDISNSRLICKGCDNCELGDECDGKDDLSNGELHVDAAKDEVWPGLAVEGGLTLIVTLK